MTEAEYIKNEFGGLVGRTIKGVRMLNKEEIADLAWEDSYGAVPFALILDDGQVIIPSEDPEGNGPGHLFLGELSTI